MDARGPWAALALSLVLVTAVPAAAQPTGGDLVGPVQRETGRVPDQPSALEFRITPGDLRRPGDPRRARLVAVYPVADNIEIGIGRFQIVEIAVRRTHVENERLTPAVRPRDRSMAAIGVSLRF